MLKSHANVSSMKTPMSAITAMIAQSSQRCDALVAMSVTHPRARRQELQDRDREDHHRHDDRDRRRVADLETVERLLDDVDGHRACCVARPSSGEDDDRFEYL